MTKQIQWDKGFLSVTPNANAEHVETIFLSTTEQYFYFFLLKPAK